MSSKQLRTVKCVSFDLEPMYRETLHHLDYTAEEVEAAWYSSAELHAIVAAAMDPANERNLEGTGCLRGLEKYTAVGSTRLEIHRVRVVAAVLREQKRQANNGRGTDKDEHLIANAAARISQECQELACLQGFNDEMEAYAGNGVTAGKDVVSLPKSGLFSRLANQVKAISDLAFLERHGKPRNLR